MSYCVSVGGRSFTPVDSPDNDGKIVICIHSRKQLGRLACDVDEDKTMSFTMTWQGMDNTTFLLPEQTTIIGWLEQLGVDDCARDDAISMINKLLEEISGLSTRPNCVGVQVDIHVYDSIYSISMNNDDERPFPFVLPNPDPNLTPEERDEIVADFLIELDRLCIPSTSLSPNNNINSKTTDDQVRKTLLKKRGVKFMDRPPPPSSSSSTSTRGDNCAICFEEYYDKEMGLLPCSHAFHSHCLIRWVIKIGDINKVTCPLCRSNLLN